MKKLLQFNWLNYITYFIQVILFFVLFIYIPSPPSTATDVGVGAAGEAVGEMIILIFLFILFIITSILYVAWIRNTKEKKSFLIVINAITFMLLLLQVISGFPYIIKESKNGCFSLINEYRRNQSITGKDDYQQIKFDGYNLRLFINRNDTNLIYVRDTTRNSLNGKFYFVKGHQLQEIDKNKIGHFINLGIRQNPDLFEEDGKKTVTVISTENEESKLVYGGTNLEYYDDDSFKEDKLPLVKIWNEFEDIKNAGELKGFKDFMPIGGKKDKNGTIYKLFWHLSNPGAAINWDEGFNEKASLCLAIRKKGEKIMVREIDLNALPPKERAIFYEDMAVEDFIVSGNYYYIIVDRKLYCHKNR